MVWMYGDLASEPSRAIMAFLADFVDPKVIVSCCQTLIRHCLQRYGLPRPPQIFVTGALHWFEMSCSQLLLKISAFELSPLQLRQRVYRILNFVVFVNNYFEQIWCPNDHWKYLLQNSLIDQQKLRRDMMRLCCYLTQLARQLQYLNTRSRHTYFTLCRA